MRMCIAVAAFSLAMQMALTSSPSYSAEGRWIPVTNTKERCEVLTHWNDPTKARWWGSCVKGKAHGNGRLELLKQDLKYWEAKVNPTAGLQMVDGVLKPDIDMWKVIFRKARCDNRNNLVNVFVDNAIDISQDQVAWGLLRRGAKYGKIACPFKNSNIRVTLNHKSDANRKIYDAFGEAYGRFDTFGDYEWHEYVNRSAQRRYAAIQKEVRSQQRARAQAERRARERRREQAEHARLEAEKQASLKLFEGFSKGAKIEAWPKIKEFAANPFVYDGQIVGLVTRFETMVRKDAALFGSGPERMIIATGVPPTQFQAAGRVLLAGRVVGKDYVKLPMLGETLVPHVEFVDAHMCAQRACQEILMWKE